LSIRCQCCVVHTTYFRQNIGRKKCAI
jgi:hypothetical protein